MAKEQMINMFAVIYRWKLKKNISEKAFVENWHKGTKNIYKKYGSLGSSLHKSDDGRFIAYARWPNKNVWEKMMKDKKESNKQCVALIGKPILMTLIDDQLKKKR